MIIIDRTYAYEASHGWRGLLVCICRYFWADSAEFHIVVGTAFNNVPSFEGPPFYLRIRRDGFSVCRYVDSAGKLVEGK